jgi:hypothetical protein
MAFNSFPINTEVGSNNKFPSVLFVKQGGSPEAPTGAIASGEVRVFVRSSDGHLCREDSSHVVTDIEHASAVTTRAIACVIDGGGVALTTGIKSDVYVPYACTITAVTMLADQSGSVVVDIWKDTYAAYPPTVADTITASAKPTITTATKSQDTTLSGWTKSIAAGSTLRFNVDSATTITRLHLSLTVTI